AAQSSLRRETTAISRPPKELLAAAGGPTTATAPAEPDPEAAPVTAPADAPKKGTGTGVRASLSKAARPAPSKVDLPNEWAEEVAPEPKTMPSGPPVASPRPKR